MSSTAASPYDWEIEFEFSAVNDYPVIVSQRVNGNTAHESVTPRIIWWEGKIPDVRPVRSEVGNP